MPETPLITTKFYIPLAQPDLVVRPRLRRLLESGLRQPLTLVSAPPGFGKTTLLAEWAQSQGKGQTAWLALEEADNQFSIFWRYAISVLRLVRPGLGETVLPALKAGANAAMEIILATLINELAELDTALFLVLDDYHLIQSQEIHASLNFLLDHFPINFHLVILTREDPPLALARRRVRRQMVEIRASDLRFNAEETAAFLNSIMGLALNPGQVQMLEERTEGWVVGLQMAALSLRSGNPQAFFDSLSGDDRYIADYLIEEVLQRQPEEIRTFLLKTSILDRLCAPLCEAVLGGSQMDLLQIERANLFLVPLDTTRTWYRYHHLFAELLKKRLVHSVRPEEISQLYRRASIWCEDHQEIQAAIRYARLVPDEERAAQLLGQSAGFFFLHNELPQLVDLAQAMPPALRRKNPNLCMGVAWAALATNQDPSAWLESIEEHFGVRAEAAVREPELPVEKRAALLEALIVKVQLPVYERSAETHDRLLSIEQRFKQMPVEQFCLFNTIASLWPVVTYDLGLDAEIQSGADIAAGYFTETIRLARKQQNSHLLHLGFGHLASILMGQSKLRAARETHELALAEIHKGSISPYAGMHHSGLGAIWYEWGDLEAAEKYFHEALNMARLWRQWEILLPSLSGLARIQRRQGNTEAALTLLQEVGGTLTRSQLLTWEALKVRWNAEDGELPKAAEWLEKNAFAWNADPAADTEVMLLETARIMLCLEKREEAVRLAERAIGSARQGGRHRLVIQGSLVLAHGWALLGQVQPAMAALDEALLLAEEENYLSSFVDEGETIRTLLVKKSGNAYAMRLLANSAPEGKASAKQITSSHPGDLLSKREQEILRLVAAGMSNQEIAEHLVISLPTVKTHIGSIFNKLGVNSRTQAIMRAREQGIILSD